VQAGLLSGVPYVQDIEPTDIRDLPSAQGYDWQLPAAPRGANHFGKQFIPDLSKFIGLHVTNRNGSLRRRSRQLSVIGLRIRLEMDFNYSRA
jgi:hypothetical protein